MKTVYRSYQVLNGQHEKLLSTIGDGHIIRLFDKTPYPTNDTDVICPHFYELAVHYGCPYNCAWCYLKGTYRYIQSADGRIPIRFKKKEDIDRSITAFLQLGIRGLILNTSELADGLCAETNFYGQPLSRYLIEKFHGSGNKLLFLTKGTYIKNFLENEWQKEAVLSWSLNADIVAQKWEKLAPATSDRIKAAKQVYDRGYEVRVRFDPMVAVENHEQHYRKLVDDVFSSFKPSRITVGCLRGLPATLARAVDKSWVPYLAEKSNWGRKPPIEVRMRLYGTVIERLKDHGFKNVAVCKDTLAVWKGLASRYGLDYQAMKCNCTNSVAGHP